MSDPVNESPEPDPLAQRQWNMDASGVARGPDLLESALHEQSMAILQALHRRFILLGTQGLVGFELQTTELTQTLDNLRGAREARGVDCAAIQQLVENTVDALFLAQTVTDLHQAEIFARMRNAERREVAGELIRTFQANYEACLAGLTPEVQGYLQNFLEHLRVRIDRVHSLLHS